MWGFQRSSWANSPETNPKAQSPRPAESRGPRPTAHAARGPRPTARGPRPAARPTVHSGVPDVTIRTTVVQFRQFWNSSGFSPDSPDSPDSGFSPDLVSSTTARDLPTTRAGGQDDVSSKQTPSNNIRVARSELSGVSLPAHLPGIFRELPGTRVLKHAFLIFTSGVQIGFNYGFFLHHHLREFLQNSRHPDPRRAW